jgi:hypothetical protein
VREIKETQRNPLIPVAGTNPVYNFFCPVKEDLPTEVREAVYGTAGNPPVKMGFDHMTVSLKKRLGFNPFNLSKEIFVGTWLITLCVFNGLLTGAALVTNYICLAYGYSWFTFAGSILVTGAVGFIATGCGIKAKDRIVGLIAGPVGGLAVVTMIALSLLGTGWALDTNYGMIEGVVKSIKADSPYEQKRIAQDEKDRRDQMEEAKERWLRIQERQAKYDEDYEKSAAKSQGTVASRPKKAEPRIIRVEPFKRTDTLADVRSQQLR